MRFSNTVWATCYSIALALLLLSSTVVLIYRRGVRRAAWVGACIFGWFYAAMVFGPAGLQPKGAGSKITHIMRSAYFKLSFFPSADMVPTGHTFTRMHAASETDVYIIVRDPAGNETAHYVPPDRIHDFVTIAHCTIAVCVMYVGALIGVVAIKTM